MLVWPHTHGDWQHTLSEIEKTYLELVSIIHRHEIVFIVCFDQAHQTHIEQITKPHGIDPNLRFTIAPSNDSWVRDTGPLTVIDIDSGPENNANNARLYLLDFSFNGWGGKYPSELDNRITGRLKQAGVFQQHPISNLSLVLEGGSIESDGQGTLLTTTRCLHNPNRNPALSTKDIEKILQTQLGAQRILWLTQGHIAGDDTDGHIDTLARFCPNNTIAYSSCNDASDIHYPALNAMAAELATFTNADGKPYRLIPLPIPAAIRNSKGESLPANYANFLIINDAVLVPTYDDPNDILALQALEAGFPDREIIGIDCRSLLQQFGSVHCATLQFPAGVLN